MLASMGNTCMMLIVLNIIILRSICDHVLSIVVGNQQVICFVTLYLCQPELTDVLLAYATVYKVSDDQVQAQ